MSKPSKRRKPRNRNSKLHLETRNQLLKLEQDATCFIEIAEISKTLRDQASTDSARIGYSTVMLTNCGLGVELKLKALQIRTNGWYTYQWDHKLVPLYDTLKKEVQNRLDQIFRSSRGPLEITGGGYDPDNIEIGENGTLSVDIEVPPVLQKWSFRSLLETFDDLFADGHGIYGRRYSFENFTKYEMWEEISIPMLPIIKEIDKYLETLPEPTFPGT